MIEPTIITALVAALGSLVSAIYSLLKKKAEQKHFEKESERLKSKAAQISVDLGILKFTHSLETSGEPIPQDEIVQQLENRILTRLKDHPNSSDEAIKAEVRQDLKEFKDRIAKIESRFPDESKLDKIASINDALLSERIDQVKERLDKLEEKALTRWDVALTVSAIIGGISFVVAATYGIIKFIGKI